MMSNGNLFGYFFRWHPIMGIANYCYHLLNRGVIASSPRLERFSKFVEVFPHLGGGINRVPGSIPAISWGTVSGCDELDS